MENVCPLVVVISDNTFSISEPLFHTLRNVYFNYNTDEHLRLHLNDLLCQILELK